MSSSKSRVKTKSSYAKSPSPPYPSPCPSVTPKPYIVLGTLPQNIRPSYNPFSPLSSSKLPTYSKAVSSTSSSPSQIINPPPLSQPSVTPIIFKSHWHPVFPIESELQHLSEPQKLLDAFLLPDWHYVPQNITKTQNFYEFILVDTDSIIISEIPCSLQSQPSPPATPIIAFHKVTIKQVLTLEQWGKSPYLTRRFSQPYDPPYFDYYDYQQAWNKTFLRQNKNLRHSWFLHFDKLQEIKTLPRWFLLWWDQFGPESLILPPPLQESLQAFTLQNDCPPSLSHCSPLLLFFLKTKLNWIMKWEYVIKPHPSLKNIMFLAHQVFVKWWEKYNYDHVVKMFSKITKAPEVLVQRSRFQAQLPTITNKKDLKKLAEAMSQVSDSDEEEDHQVRLSPAQQTTSSPLQQASPSQQASHSHDNSPYYPSQMMDSQDLYELELANYDPQIM
ncbi:hypothetical protein CIPAW_11G040600 [Carya illinoinensis]|uniref:Uncharacterized protein n=1 Tax=Carya illinoinensis TaxID=32201 RepID=A0A8T1NY91_CARIL|nr:hypothetical protein CIPAW_11G040600 [Carya illinoinensis]